MSGLVKFTAPDGNPVWIGAQWVTLVRHALPGEPGETRINIGGVAQNVREHPAAVVAMLQQDTFREFEEGETTEGA